MMNDANQRKQHLDTFNSNNWTLWHGEKKNIRLSNWHLLLGSIHCWAFQGICSHSETYRILSALSSKVFVPSTSSMNAPVI